MVKVKLPARSSHPKMGGKIIPVPDSLKGRGDLKIILRERAKKHPFYSIPIELDPPVHGMTDTGIPIPVNTLGRWIWGIPGYKGNAIFDGIEGRIYLPKEAPVEALKLIVEILKEGR